jgi:hypothetical protein
MKITSLFVLCDVCNSPNIFDDLYANNLRYVAWIRCTSCGQKMNLSDEVKRAGWDV